MRKALTLCMICEGERILLGMKKRGFGAGRWNGFGGKVEEGESIEEAAHRELHEEAGIKPIDIEKAGILEFSFEDNPKLLEVHVFKVNTFEGRPTETEEMEPRWFQHNEIPFEQMWTDDQHWIPLLLAGKQFKGHFHFDRPSDAEYAAQILEHQLEEVNEL